MSGASGLRVWTVAFVKFYHVSAAPSSHRKPDKPDQHPVKSDYSIKIHCATDAKRGMERLGDIPRERLLADS